MNKQVMKDYKIVDDRYILYSKAKEPASHTILAGIVIFSCFILLTMLFSIIEG